MTPLAALKRALNRPLVSGTTALLVSASLAGGVAVAVDRPSSANAATTSNQATEAARAQAAAQAEVARRAAAARQAAAAKAAAAKAAAAKAEAQRKAAAKAKAEAEAKAAAKAKAERKAAAKRKAAARAAAARKAARRAAAARKAERAAERRAAERRAQKRRAAKRKAAARSQRVSRSTERRAVSGGSPRAIARSMVASRGWGSSQFGCLDRLWNKESGWKVTANNPSSSAYGIPQALPGSKMANAGPDWQHNARTQITWGLNYISASYGTPCAAWAHSRASNWY
ncbi:MAG TPA: hypothetical protein VKB14_10220 [Actinomycetales bacterium]|nr:hypothetical protein [Actinomycetales bacterium]